MFKNGALTCKVCGKLCEPKEGMLNMLVHGKISHDACVEDTQADKEAKQDILSSMD